jgi:hypothetical protein
VRAATAIAQQNVSGFATTFVGTPGTLVYVAAFAYSANGLESTPLAVVVAGIDRSGFKVQASDAGGGTVDPVVVHSGGIPVNRLWGKALTGDPDTADSIIPGSLKRIPALGATDSSGNVDLAGTAWVNRNIDNVTDGTSYGRPILSRLSAGKPLIDFSEAIHVNKTQDYIADSATRFASPVPNATSDVVLVASAGITLGGNNAVRGATTAAWNEQVYSKDGYTGGAFAQASPQETNTAKVFGLNTDPTLDAADTGIDYAIYPTNGGALYASESGTFTIISASYAVGDVLAVTYDGSNIRYLQNGTVLRTVAVGAGIKFFFDSSFYNVGATLNNIRFGPLSSNNAASVGAGNFGTGINESGGKAVNRLLGKALAGDADNLDGVVDGTTFARIGASRLNGGVIRRSGGFDDGSTAAKSTDALGQLLHTNVAESAGKAVNRLFGKALAADPDSADSVVTGAVNRSLPLSVLTANNDLNARKLVGTGSTPGISVPTGTGAMGTSPTGTIAGTDTAGKIHTIVGTAPAASGDICTVTFAVAYAAAPFVVISGGSSGGVNAKAYSINVTTTAFTITTTAGYGGAGAALDYYYQVIA